MLQHPWGILSSSFERFGRVDPPPSYPVLNPMACPEPVEGARIASSGILRKESPRIQAGIGWTSLCTANYFSPPGRMIVVDHSTLQIIGQPPAKPIRSTVSGTRGSPWIQSVHGLALVVLLHSSQKTFEFRPRTETRARTFCTSPHGLPSSDRKRTRSRNSARVKASASPDGITEPLCLCS